MKFRFYITGLYGNSIRGIDSEDQAKEYAEFDNFFVVDTLHGLWLRPGNTSEEVTKIGKPKLDPESKDKE